MGTNYYHALSAPCPTCHRSDPPVYIGKSSYGWCFSLHVGDDAPDDLAGWQERWQAGVIRNEYGTTLTAEDMLFVITARHGRPWDEQEWRCYGSEEKFHASNQSERGPNNLLRHRIDGRHCVGHGPGTWDLIRGEFS